jgi:DNA-binding response OmpR family regulator/glycine cleavage system H lipoate-binding protein
MSSQSSILVVDDEEPICTGCRRVLSREGFLVECSTDAAEGLKMAEGRPYDVILLDLRMPDLDGLTFLDRLHAKKPGLPVIVITGYPSVESASESMRLGAREFLSKPFTPEQIRDKVRRVLSDVPIVAEREPAPAEAAEPAWNPATDDYLFHDEAWLRLGWDGTAQVGAFLPRRVAPIRSVVLPKVGDIVHRGLPLAAIELEGDWRVPSPLSGEVVEVNESFRRTAPRAWNRPCPGLWIAHIQPRRLAEDLRTCEPHEVLVGVGEDGRRTWLDLLTGLGCRVRTAGTSGEMRRALADADYRVVLLDAGSLGWNGPTLAQEIHEEHPGVKVVVVAKYPHRWERAYRSGGVFAYAAAAFADREIVDIVFRAFESRELREAQPPDTGFGPQWIHGIRLATGPGTLARLQVYDASLLGATGVGLCLLRRIIMGAHVIETLRGRRPLTFKVRHVMEKLRGERGRCERLVILRSEDTGAIPGTLTVDDDREPAETVRRLGMTMTTLIVQPERRGAALDFDGRTNEALAEHILEQVTTRK